MTRFDLEICARTIWGEARGETPEGQRAVMHVLLNRLATGRWKTLAAVCLASKQFSCWNDSDPNRIKMCEASDKDLWAAFAIVDNPGDDLTFGAEYYYTLAIKPPPWAADMQRCGIIGKHVFYKEKPNVSA